jgi:ribosome maturation factor RimP
MAQHRGRLLGGAQREPGVGGAQDRSRPAAARSGRPVYRPDAARAGGEPGPLRVRLREIVTPVVAGAGFDLEELVLSRVGRRHLLRVVVDADGGVSLNAVADLSRAISAALDAAEAAVGDLMTGEYLLEVGSPGVDRPLTQPWHWRRNVGRLVKVKAGGRQVTGRILGADDNGVRLRADEAVHELPFADLGPGRVQVEFGHADDLADDGVAEDEIDEIDEEEGEDGE